MLRWSTLFLLLLFFNYASFSQSMLSVEGVSPKLFLNHKVAPKENFYSVSRKYNVPPKDLAAYNNLQFEKGLGVGQTIKIPLNEVNFSQAEISSASQNLIPVYHSVLPKEGLYRISLNYNKVPLTTIKKWNHLVADNVSVESEGRLARPGAQIIEVPETEPKIAPVKTDESKTNVSQTNKTDIDKPKKKEAISPVQPDQYTGPSLSGNTKSGLNFSGGYFKKLYDDQALKKSPVNDIGNAGVFKSTSGWQDGKYYCFNNDAPPGSVIRITNNVTDKSVYAKVLDAIPDIKQNSGLVIIISNAAAEELGGGDKFNCALSYIK